MVYRRKKNHTAKIIALGIAVSAGIGVYSYLEHPQPVSAVNNLVAEQPIGPQAGSDLLAIVNKVKSLNLDSSIFASPAFRSLQDYSVEIAPQAVGKINPFAPLGSAGKSTAKTRR